MQKGRSDSFWEGCSRKSQEDIDEKTRTAKSELQHGRFGLSQREDFITFSVNVQ